MLLEIQAEHKLRRLGVPRDRSVATVQVDASSATGRPSPSTVAAPPAATTA